VVEANGGVHRFMNHSGNVLTDSGGFQMVSLASLSVVSEEGVEFESPADGTRIMLSPEASIHAQHSIGADIIMALDDVVHSCTNDDKRFAEATDRTLRWLDRCLNAHEPRKHVQALFAIVQGGLDVRDGGLRDLCIRGFAERDDRIPGYAIGGVAGGEAKDSFWRVVKFCCDRLPANKPRYLMGVGDPLDLVVCVALGVDMFDCVYPTRTGRFGTALTKFGTLNLKHSTHAKSFQPLEVGCTCAACQYPRAAIHMMFRQAGSRQTLAGALLSLHNIAYMLRLSAEMRSAIVKNQYADMCRQFLRDRYDVNIPAWVREALGSVNIQV
jgi:tRNA-guanine transglycosylase